MVRLGWSHGDQEIFSVAEMIKLFALDNINKSGAAFDTEKLLWLNQHYIKTLPVEDVSQRLLEFSKLYGNGGTNTAAKVPDSVTNSATDSAANSATYNQNIKNIDFNNGPDIKQLVLVLRDRAKTLLDMLEQSWYFYVDAVTLNPDAVQKHFKDPILVDVFCGYF